MTKRSLFLAAGTLSVLVLFSGRPRAIEIPLDTIAPVRIGFVDLQKVFDTFPEKSFAEGDLLREVEKRKRQLSQRQALITTLRRQISLDQSALEQAKAGQAVLVPQNMVPVPQAPAPAAVATQTEVKKSSSTPVEPYPTEDPFSSTGVPEVNESSPSQKGSSVGALPGMQMPVQSVSPYALLDGLSGTSPVSLNAEAMAQLAKRIEDNRRLLLRETAAFKDARINSVEDMKILEREKTYGVMVKIYAVMQVLARDEGVAVVLDKSYVLYGEDSVDLSEKLIERLREQQPL